MKLTQALQQLDRLDAQALELRTSGEWGLVWVEDKPQPLALSQLLQILADLPDQSGTQAVLHACANS